MAADNVNDAEDINIDSEGGYILVMTLNGGTADLRKTDATALAARLQKADTALQEGDVGGAAMKDEDYYVPLSTHLAVVAGLNARLEAIEAIIGAGQIVVFEGNVFEEGVFN